MVAYTVLFHHIKRSKKTGQSCIFFLVPKSKVDLKMIDDKNNVLTDYELFIVRNFFKLQNMHAYTYEISIPMDLRLLIVLKIKTGKTVK